jgi:ubiquinone/menaquinone biosynthesis C-methylase UbiE
MPRDPSSEVAIQRRYYHETASYYNDMHGHGKDYEHYFALCMLIGMADYLAIESVLDIGSGTGRAITHIKKMRPDLLVRGIEPVSELREVGYAQGISPAELTEGDALALEFADGEFDLVCAFGVLHHVRRPEVAIGEMLRVASKAIFISDSNNFGQGSRAARCTKQILNALNLWSAAILFKTKGKGYQLSEGDGLAYSYSVFTNYEQISQHCKTVHLTNTVVARINPYRTAGHVALLGIKK